MELIDVGGRSRSPWLDDGRQEVIVLSSTNPQPGELPPGALGETLEEQARR